MCVQPLLYSSGSTLVVSHENMLKDGTDMCLLLWCPVAGLTHLVSPNEALSEARGGKTTSRLRC